MPAPSEADTNDFSSSISSRNKLRAVRQLLENSEAENKSLREKFDKASKNERVYRHKYAKMKSTARKEKTARKRAQTDLAQLQGMVQGFQMTAGTTMMSSPVMRRPIQTVQTVQPFLFGNMLQSNGGYIEEASMESAGVPDDI